MKLEYHHDPCKSQHVYTLVIDDIERAFCLADKIDVALLRECDLSNLISDKILALECITRRIEQLKKDL